MMDQISRDEFYTVIQGLARAQESGFDGINTRLDRLNGKVDRHDGELATLKATAIEPQASRDRGRNRQITERDVRMVTATLVAVGAVLVFIKSIWPALVALVKP